MNTSYIRFQQSLWKGLQNAWNTVPFMALCKLDFCYGSAYPAIGLARQLLVEVTRIEFQNISEKVYGVRGKVHL
jgi:hypothetical protein